MKTLLSLGHGYSARFLSRVLSDEGGWKIIGTTRSESGFAAIRESGAEARLWSEDRLIKDFGDATHLLVSVAPTTDCDPVLRNFSDAIASATDLNWIGYLSTTSVYGDRGGGWVDEDSETRPATERGKLRLAAERSWQALAAEFNLPLHVFRLAGIYGPGRGPMHQLLSGGRTRIVGSGQFFNRIHVRDIARVLRASMLRPDPGAIYNVCDDLPARSDEVMEYAANLVGVRMPKRVAFADAELSEMARSFYSESKRVRNERVKSRLKIRLQYPDYRIGLRALNVEWKEGRHSQ